MTQKSIKCNYIYNLIYQILTLITPLITAPYISRILGADGIGTFSYTSSIVSYFTLFAAIGISSYGQREISYYQDNYEKRTEIFWNAKALSFITSAFCLIFYFLYILFFDKNNTILYLILTLNIISIVTDVGWVFQGLEEFGIIVLRNIVARLLNVAVIFIFVHKKEDLILYALTLTLTNFLCNISLWGFIPRYIGKINLKTLHPFTDFKTIFSLFIPTIAVSIYTVLDKTMIGFFSQESFENGYYEQATKLSKMLLVLVTSLGTVVLPRVGYLFEKKDISQIQNLMYRSYRFVWFVGIPLCLGLIGVAPNFVHWFYGSGFEKVIPLLSILSFLIIAIGINNVTGIQYFIPTKRQNIFTITVITGAVVNLICNIFFIPRWQSIGAAVGSVLAESTIAIVQIVIVRKELSPAKIFSTSVKYVIAGLIMLALLVFENHYLQPSILHTGIMVVTGSLTYFFILFVLRDAFFIENCKKIIENIVGKIKRKTGE